MAAPVLEGRHQTPRNVSASQHSPRSRSTRPPLGREDFATDEPHRLLHHLLRKKHCRNKLQNMPFILLLLTMCTCRRVPVPDLVHPGFGFYEQDGRSSKGCHGGANGACTALHTRMPFPTNLQASSPCARLKILVRPLLRRPGRESWCVSIKL